MSVPKNAELQCLRAIAAMLVVVHHLQTAGGHIIPLPAILSENTGLWTGVDLFFVISGYLIAKSLIVLHVLTKEARKAHLKQFFVRRGFRLLPAAWLWIVIPLILSLLINDQSHFAPISTLKTDAKAAFFNIANFYYPYCYSQSLQGVLCSSIPVLGPYWSLSVEEQFYVMLPLCMLVFGKRGVLAVCIGLVVTGLFLNRHLLGFLWYSRLDGLLWGVMIAYFSATPYYAKLASSVSRHTGATVLALALLACVAWMGKLGGASLAGITPFWPFSVSITAMASSLLVLMASLDKGVFVSNASIRRILTPLGDRSYSIYLCHTPIIHLSKWLAMSAAPALTSSSLLTLALFIVLCTVATELTYRICELPLRTLGRQIAERWNQPVMH